MAPYMQHMHPSSHLHAFQRIGVLYQMFQRPHMVHEQSQRDVSAPIQHVDGHIYFATSHDKRRLLIFVCMHFEVSFREPDKITLNILYNCMYMYFNLKREYD
jgi:hypothetical protein